MQFYAILITAFHIQKVIHLQFLGNYKKNMQKNQICITDAWLEICFNNNIYFINYFKEIN